MPRPSEVLNQHREAIRRIVAAHRASNPRVFGSVLRGEDGEGSDLDLLVEPQPGMSLFDLGGISTDLHDLLGIEVDVLTPKALPTKWRAAILAQAEPV
jgi:uncharacterized protein